MRNEFHGYAGCRLKIADSFAIFFVENLTLTVFVTLIESWKNKLHRFENANVDKIQSFSLSGGVKKYCIILSLVLYDFKVTETSLKDR